MLVQVQTKDGSPGGAPPSQTSSPKQRSKKKKPNVTTLTVQQKPGDTPGSSAQGPILDPGGAAKRALQARNKNKDGGPEAARRAKSADRHFGKKRAHDEVDPAELEAAAAAKRADYQAKLKQRAVDRQKDAKKKDKEKADYAKNLFKETQAKYAAMARNKSAARFRRYIPFCMRKPGQICKFSDDSHPAEVIEQVGLTANDLMAFEDSFNEIDAAGDGEITFTDLIAELGPMSDNKLDTGYMKRLFRYFDTNKDQSMAFGDWLEMVMCYGMLSRTGIVRFVFDSLDLQGTGLLAEPEFEMLIMSLHSAHGTKEGMMFPGNTTLALKEFDINKDGVLDFSEVMLMYTRYPMIFFPAFCLQSILQQVTLGEGRFQVLQERMVKKAALWEYYQGHNGNLPPLKVGELFEIYVLRRSNPQKTLLGRLIVDEHDVGTGGKVLKDHVDLNRLVASLGKNKPSPKKTANPQNGVTVTDL